MVRDVKNFKLLQFRHYEYSAGCAKTNFMPDTEGSTIIFPFVSQLFFFLFLVSIKTLKLSTPKKVRLTKRRLVS